MSFALTKYPLNDTLFSGNSIEFHITTDTLAVLVKCTVILYPDSSKSNVLLSVDLFKSVSSQTCKFDLSLYIDQFLRNQERSFDFGILSAAHIQKANNYVFIDIEFTQYNTIDQQIGSSILRSYKAISAATEADTDYFIEYLNSSDTFLTFIPQPQSFSSSVCFSWYNKLSGIVKLCAKFTFPDLSSKTVVLQAPSLDEGVFDFFYTISDLLVASGEAFSKVDFWFRSEIDVNISDVRSFILDNQIKRFERLLIIRNSLGGLDLVRLLGKADDKIKFERTVLEFDTIIRNVETVRKQDFSINSGFFIAQNTDVQAFQNWFVHEVLNANEAYLLTTKKLIEVRIVNEDESAFTDDDFMSNIAVKLETCKILKSFTTPALNVPGNDDIPIENYIAPGFINTGYYGNN